MENTSERLGLGIDTGGTYTDAALYDLANNTVLREAKAPTTPHDLSVGIAQALDLFTGKELRSLSSVALSTTLATNACVENKGGRAALLLLGYDERLVDRLCAEYGLERAALTVLPGRHTQRGEEHEEPDWDAVRAWALQASGACGALGVAEYWGVRNPAYEMRALDILRESGLPAAAAHQLSGEINSLKRAATTLLNLRLIPLMRELLDAVRSALDAREVTAPLWIVRGDGALMSERSALEKPVELLLSGPAASAQGGARLFGGEDCLVVDTGGTTTDIAVLRGGRVALEEEGATVGGWRTGTRAAQVRTIGLGGDTRVTLGKDGELLLDVRRALPLCRLAQQMPAVKDALRRMLAREERRGYHLGEWLMISRNNGQSADSSEAALLDALGDGPLSVEDAAAAVGVRPYFLNSARLEGSGTLLRSALTLTDLWHVTGQMSLYDAEAANLGVELLAQRLEIPPQELIRKALRLADRRMFALLSDHLLSRYSKRIDLSEAIGHSFDGTGDEISLRLTTSLPLVGIGAPAHLLLPQAAERLGTSAVLPEHAGVGGAVGAITGMVACEAEAVVRPIFEAWGVEGFFCHAPDETTQHDTLEEARKAAETAARRVAAERAASMGAEDVEMTLIWRDSSGKAAGATGEAFLLEARVTARAAGKAGK